jgi:hypothetical protein
MDIEKNRIVKPSYIAEKLHVSEATVRRWCQQCVIPSRQIGGRWFIDLDQFVEHFFSREQHCTRESNAR